MFFFDYVRSFTVAFICLSNVSCINTQPRIDYGSIEAFSTRGDLQMVVEIPAGTNKKIEYDHDKNNFPIDIKNGEERIIDFLPYPGNYGFVPSTMMNRMQGGDGDALDVLVLSEHAPTQSVLEIIPIALLSLLDNGEIDYKIVAVPVDPVRRVIDAVSLSDLTTKYPNLQQIIELWFTSYKGPGVIEFNGWANEHTATTEIEKWLVPK